MTGSRATAVAADRSPPGVDGPDDGGLRRAVTFPMLVLYGLGTTIGAGIYALTGEVAAEAGTRAPLSFLLAALLAGTTALGFAELAGRLPRAAGEAVFVDHAFGSRPLTTVVGLGIMVAGLVAAAAISDAFGGYLSEVVALPRSLLTVWLIAVLALIAVVGVRESVGAAAIFTVIEVGGLALVLWAGRDSLADAVTRAGDLLGPPAGITAWGGVMGGAFLAFFAFLGFEDIDSLAEETRDPRVTLPRAVVVTLGITTAFYVVVSSVAVLQVEPAELGRSDAPLALVYERAGGHSEVLATIAALAMVNGALVQLVMVPRVLYGLARLGVLPADVGAVSARSGTPVRATVVAAVVIALAAATLDLGLLARITSAATMAIFVATNASLLVLQRRDGPTESFQVPGWLPVLGIIASVGLFAAELGPLLTR